MVDYELRIPQGILPPLHKRSASASHLIILRQWRCVLGVMISASPRGHVLQLLLFFIWIKAALACNSKGGTYGDYRVTKRSDSNGKQVVVAMGENRKLSCQTNVPWKNCVWKPPRNGVRQLKCLFSRHQYKKVSCPSFPEVHYFRDRRAPENECSIIVNKVNEHHEGAWKCEFELDLPNMGTDKIWIYDQVCMIVRDWRYV